jgi:cytidine deaminase
MIANGESKITKLVCCFSDATLGLPCGACREFLMRLDKDSGDIEILANYEKRETITLKDLIPSWQGFRRISKPRMK